MTALAIPIENIYYLLCYAWDRLEERDVIDVAPLASTTLADLFARVLVNGTSLLLKRGLDRGYLPHHERTNRLRGRVDFADAARRRSPSLSLPCTFDELSHDVLHNRILKSTLRRLSRVPQLTPSLKDQLIGLWRSFAAVQDVTLTDRVFGLVQLHRNNRVYDLLLRICELTHRNLLVSEEPGVTRFREFAKLDDEMPGLYENFVRNFFKRELRPHGWVVRRDDVRWDWVPTDAVSKQLLPKMQTDVSLSKDARKVILECKYTPNATQIHHAAEKLRSQHLYQVHAYLNHPAVKDGATPTEVMLLYPTATQDVRASYVDGGRMVHIRTINLNQPWPGIHRDLLDLVLQPAGPPPLGVASCVMVV